MASKKRRSLISGAPRSGRPGDEASGDLAADDTSSGDGSSGEGSDHPTSEVPLDGGVGELESAARMAQSAELARTDRFPTMARPQAQEDTTEHPANDVVITSSEANAEPRAPNPGAGADPSATPGGVDRDGWFVKTGQPAPRREADPELGVISGPSPVAWLLALGLAVAIALGVAAIVWLVVG